MQILAGEIEVNSTIGTISTLSIIPKKMSNLMILGHGAGAGMQHRFMQGLAEALASKGIGTVRYNFPYMENRKGRPDVPAIAQRTILSVIEEVSRLYPNQRIVLAGKSFGGRMASQTMAKYPAANIRALIFYGFPLHSPAKPGTDRAAHLFDVKIPMLFLQGDRDALARLDLLQPLIQQLPLATLQILVGGDHSFKFLKSSGISEDEALNSLANKSSEFLQSI